MSLVTMILQAFLHKSMIWGSTIKPIELNWIHVYLYLPHKSCININNSDPLDVFANIFTPDFYVTIQQFSQKLLSTKKTRMLLLFCSICWICRKKGHGYFIVKTALPLLILAKNCLHCRITERKTASNFHSNQNSECRQKPAISVSYKTGVFGP